MFGVEKTLLVFNLILDLLLTTIYIHNNKGRTRARDTATSMNMTVDLDTDPTYEDTTEQAVVVVLPLMQCLDPGPNGASEVTKVWQKIV